MSCSTDTQPLTQVMVVVDSSMAQITAVRVRVEGMGDPKVAMASDLSKHPLPRTVAVVHRGGPLGPIEITAEGLDGDEILVQRRAQLSFVRGRNLVLELELEQSCVDFQPQCGDDQTCIDGGCETAEVDARRLSDWSGKVPKHDDAGSGGDADSGIGKGGGESGVGGHSGNGGAGGLDMGGTGGSISGTGAGGSEGGMGGNTVTQACTDCSFDPGVTAHGNLTCDSGVCNLHCEEGYSDADQMRGNGCEKADSAFPWKVSNIDPDDATLMAATTPSITIDCSGTLDLGGGPLASTIDVCGQQLQPVVVAQASGPEIVVFATQHLAVAAGSTYRFTGSRPVAFLVYGDAEIAGKLDVSAIGETGGPGSNTVCNPGIGGNGANDAEHAGGGGGGGFGTIGSSGANSDPEKAVGGPGGATSVETALVPLRGGCPGGTGGKSDGANAAGGGGGGALQISASGTLRVSGVISAAGGGGRPGSDESLVYGDGGGGGGSGGGILLEATSVETVSGAWITTNGGGGGTGRVFNVDADAGDDGAHASSSVAAGGSSWNSAGGNGAAGTMPSAPAPACSATLGCGGGGGGGGAGRIVLRSADCQLAGSASPPATCSAHL